jgi:glycosyltransferase involved in cell wall biosynthesis
MRILIATPYLPWPLSHGGSVAQYSALACLASDHEFTLVAPLLEAGEVRHAAELADRLPRVKIRAVPCYQTVSKPPPDPLWWRGLRRGARLLRSPGGSRAVVPPEPSTPELLWYPFTPPARHLVEAVIEELRSKPDILQVEFVQLLALGAGLETTARKLFVHHQVHAVYAQRCLEAGGPTPWGEFLARWMRVEERAYLSHYDGAVVFCRADQVVLQRELGVAQVWESPFPSPADIQPFAGEPAPFSGRLVFIGSEGHQPNVDALRWLLSEIWPPLRRERPELRLLVVGQWQSATVAALGGMEGVELTGFVVDLAAVLRGGVVVVPLRVGSGIRTKILAAMAAGAPVVSTPHRQRGPAGHLRGTSADM